MSADCSAYLSVTVTPCPSTTTTTTTTTSTSVTTATSTVTATTTLAFAGKKRVPAESPFPLSARAAAPPATTTTSACTPASTSSTKIPAWASSACTANPTPAAARFTSACSCNGITPATTTLAPVTSTVTATSTTTTVSTTTTTTTVAATVTAAPKLFILQDTGYQQYYIQIPAAGGNVALVTDPSQASPLYVDANGQWRSLTLPGFTFVDTYQPNAGTANDVIQFGQSTANTYSLTCDYIGHNAGDFWGDCSASGSPDGNPLVYGFGNCPNDSTELFMTPNDSNVHCFNGGYSFLGFYLVAYNP